MSGENNNSAPFAELIKRLNTVEAQVANMQNQTRNIEIVQQLQNDRAQAEKKIEDRETRNQSVAYAVQLRAGAQSTAFTILSEAAEIEKYIRTGSFRKSEGEPVNLEV